MSLIKKVVSTSRKRATASISIAFSALVILPYTVVYVIAHQISIIIGKTPAPTHTKHIFLVSCTVAIACRDIVTSALIRLSGSVTHPTRI
jgi:uncharacterized membrane protein